MSQIIRITSEALQATIRRLLPSQQGFGEDLQASNVIQPIIDLTPTAEGSALSQDLQEAINYGSATFFTAANTTATIANTPGFYKIDAAVTIQTETTNTRAVSFTIARGGTVEFIYNWRVQGDGAGGPQYMAFPVSFRVFLDTGDTLRAVTDDADARIVGSSRQIADRYGNLSNPSGFTFE